MIYRLPRMEDKEILMDYVAEHYSNYQRSISASNNLVNMDFEDWVGKINKNSEVADDEWGKYLLYLVFDDEEKLIGLLNIRYDLEDELRKLYGDVGYGVRPSERRKGYATKMLEDAKEICRQKKMSFIILGCYDENTGSNKTIINNGGILFKTRVEERKVSEYCSIELKCNYYKIDL